MPVAVIFWALLIIALIVAFVALLPKVTNNADPLPAEAEQGAPPPPSGAIAPQEPAAEGQRDSGSPSQPPAPQEREPEAAKPPQGQAAAERPAEQPPSPPPEERPPDTRDRGIYFMQAERGGAALTLTRASRRLGVSDSPLLDSINALIAGPSAEERSRGLSSFVPPNTRIIGAEVRGSTAYLNFNEEFQYNTFGREGSAAQVRQIVWTATEFPNINDVQILIEGRRVDFLNEGIMIGSPIGRN